MFPSKPYQLGFTLIELLIVMVIMSLSLSLVIPITMQQVDAAQARAERNKIVQWVEQVKIRSYFAKTPMQLLFEDFKLTARLGEDNYDLQLQHISFPEQQVKIYPEGRIEQGDVKAVIRQANWILVINDEETRWSNTD